MSETPRDPLRAISVDMDKVLHSLFENAIEGILVADSQSNIVMVNTRTSEIFGYEKEAMLGMEIQQLIPSRFHHIHEEHVDDYQHSPRKRPKSKDHKLYGRRADGKEIQLGISLNPIEIEAGLYIVAHIIDKTEIESISQSLEENENLLKSLVENAVDGIITMDSKGLLKSLNPAAARLFGYEPKEIIGKNVKILMPEPHHSSHDGYLQNYHESGKAKIIGIGREVEGKRKDGSLFPFYLSVSKIKLAQGHFYAGIVHDLTEQKKAENELKKYSEELEQRVESRTSALAQAIKRLEKEVQERKSMEKVIRQSQKETQEALVKERELNELKSRFVSMASHEFRTPLATILSSTNLLEKYQDAAFEDRRYKHLDRIKSNVKNLTSILNDFLSLSRLEEGEVELNVQEINIESLVQEVKGDMDMQLKQGQSINYVHEGIENTIFLDPRLLQNIFINLLSNAIKYSAPDSEVHLHTKLEGDTFFIQIQDQGIGISDKDMEHLFERFFRAKNATNIQGTGLGLHIVKRHVELMQGSIEAKSMLNKGTTFRITLPHNLSKK